MIAWMARRSIGALALAAALVATSPARAATYLFTITGNKTASFTLDSSPVPSTSDQFGFTLSSVSGTFEGSSMTFDLTFWLLSASGGMDLNPSGGGGGLSTQGDQLFSGSQSNPTFLTGTFPLSTFGSDNDRLYSLTISDLPDAVPEPATWLMMVVGFAAIGFSQTRARLRTA